MNAHIVIPHRSHFTWKQTTLVIRQDFAGLQLSMLNLPGIVVWRERERYCWGKISSAFYKFRTTSSIFFNSDMKFTCRTISLTETVRTWVSCVVLGLEEHALFDPETERGKLLDWWHQCWCRLRKVGKLSCCWWTKWSEQWWVKTSKMCDLTITDYNWRTEALFQAF